jgi:hypothetical protein
MAINNAKDNTEFNHVTWFHRLRRQFLECDVPEIAWKSQSSRDVVLVLYVQEDGQGHA